MCFVYSADQKHPDKDIDSWTGDPEWQKVLGGKSSISYKQSTFYVAICLYEQ